MNSGCARSSSAPPRVLVIAGLDPSGGAGLVADITALRHADCLPGALATTLTAQGVTQWFSQYPVEPLVFREQCQALTDGPLWNAVKIGATGSAAIATEIAHLLAKLRAKNPKIHVVMDPVLTGTSGGALSHPDGIGDLLSEVDLITPNLQEWQEVCKRPDSALPMRLLTDDENGASLWQGDSRIADFPFERLPGNWRGTGCRLSSLITARLAHGDDMQTACGSAVEHLQSLIRTAIARNQGNLLG